MTLDGAKIYNHGVAINYESEEKIRQIVTAIKTLSPSSNVSMRFLKYGKVYEGLLWGNAHDNPIGVYNRGPSLNHVLDMIHRKVKKECLKQWRYGHGQMVNKDNAQTYNHKPLAMAG